MLLLSLIIEERIQCITKRLGAIQQMLNTAYNKRKKGKKQRNKIINQVLLVLTAGHAQATFQPHTNLKRYQQFWQIGRAPSWHALKNTLIALLPQLPNHHRCN
jgi:hypothetical protein